MVLISVFFAFSLISTKTIQRPPKRPVTFVTQPKVVVRPLSTSKNLPKLPPNPPKPKRMAKTLEDLKNGLPWEPDPEEIANLFVEKDDPDCCKYFLTGRTSFELFSSDWVPNKLPGNGRRPMAYWHRHKKEILAKFSSFFHKIASCHHFKGFTKISRSTNRRRN